MNIPEQLRYTKSHEWVRVEGAEAVVGITDHAQRELTDIVFVELPPPGKLVEANKECAVVESVKTASDIYAPVSGEVIAVNTELENAPQLVNQDPYGKGWLYRVRLTNPAEIESLLTAAQYAAHIGAK
ncbi:MAG: glycine cleavage system protein GcvH [Verrucomicrobiae bacterium]|nr:glycine cleavage system protein GcvH [Verrucomicrobiae bacterium]MCX7721969.1 glycine cleavage system protein GcvH [Verrucomicrobiae bacterium]MDW7979668.1 glycine cleavage system protein GcvH [Verrucomicrobiales bacterium]